MTDEALGIIQMVAPAIAAAVGSVVATKVSVARLQSDVKTLFKKVDGLSDRLHEATIEQEREYGDLKTKLAELRVKVNQIGAPWQRKTDPES